MKIILDGLLSVKYYEENYDEEELPGKNRGNDYPVYFSLSQLSFLLIAVGGRLRLSMPVLTVLQWKEGYIFFASVSW